MWFLKSIRINSKCHGTSSVHAAQQQFVGLVALVTAVCLVLMMFWPQSVLPPPPVPVKSRLFVTSECGYDRRLGNTMFTFAAMLGIAQRNDMTPIIEVHSPLLDTFKLGIRRTTDLTNTMGTSLAEYHEFGRRGSAYDRATEHLFKSVGRVGHVFLRGYFQSWRYFENVADEVRRNFVFKDDIAQNADEFLSSVIPTEWKSDKVKFVRVGVHVRRGDMLDGYFSNYGYTTAPSSYFVTAMNMFVRNYTFVQFVVCSDDILWCQANIPAAAEFGENVDVVFSVKKSLFVDLAVLSRCDHIIMSVGSFGWWGAWLANGTTIYYAKWPRAFSMLEYHVNKKEYFPAHWIPVE